MSIVRQPTGGLVEDQDRRSVDERLQRLVGIGRLSLDDYEQRSGALWGARTHSELAAVMADLPPEAEESQLMSVVRFSFMFCVAGAVIAWAGTEAMDAIATSDRGGW